MNVQHTNALDPILPPRHACNDSIGGVLIQVTIRVCPFPGVLEPGEYIICPPSTMKGSEVAQLFQAALGAPVADDVVLVGLFDQVG